MKTNYRSKAEKLVQLMGQDNGCNFKPLSAEWMALMKGLGEMQKAGCRLTHAALNQMAAGEMSETEERFSKYSGWKTVSETLNKIFDWRIVE